MELSKPVSVLALLGVVYLAWNQSPSTDGLPKENSDRNALRSLPSDPAFETKDATNEGKTNENARLTQQIKILAANQQQIHSRLNGVMDELAALQKNAPEQTTSQQTRSSDAGHIHRTEQERVQRREARVMDLDTSLNSESIDETWQASAQMKINEVIDGTQLAGTDLVDLDCRDTLCKLEVSHHDETALEEFEENFAHQLAWNTSRFSTTEQGADGRVYHTIYLSREGHALPSPE